MSSSFAQILPNMHRKSIAAMPVSPSFSHAANLRCDRRGSR